EGVNVEIYQRQGSRDDPPGFFSDDKLAIGATPANGRFPLPNRPAPAHETPGGYKQADNPFGNIDMTGTNGLLLARLSKEGVTEYHFLRIFDFNVAYLRGNQNEYVHILQTAFAPPGAPKRMDTTRLYFEPGMPPGRASFRWKHWGGMNPGGANPAPPAM